MRNLDGLYRLDTLLKMMLSEAWWILVRMRIKTNNKWVKEKIRKKKNFIPCFPDKKKLTSH